MPEPRTVGTAREGTVATRLDILTFLSNYELMRDEPVVPVLDRLARLQVNRVAVDAEIAQAVERIRDLEENPPHRLPIPPAFIRAPTPTSPNFDHLPMPVPPSNPNTAMGSLTFASGPAADEERRRRRDAQRQFARDYDAFQEEEARVIALRVIHGRDFAQAHREQQGELLRAHNTARNNAIDHNTLVDRQLPDAQRRLEDLRRVSADLEQRARRLTLSERQRLSLRCHLHRLLEATFEVDRLRRAIGDVESLGVAADLAVELLQAYRASAGFHFRRLEYVFPSPSPSSNENGANDGGSSGGDEKDPDEPAMEPSSLRITLPPLPLARKRRRAEGNPVLISKRRYETLVNKASRDRIAGQRPLGGGRLRLWRGCDVCWNTKGEVSPCVQWVPNSGKQKREKCQACVPTRRKCLYPEGSRFAASSCKSPPSFLPLPYLPSSSRRSCR